MLRIDVIQDTEESLVWQVWQTDYWQRLQREKRASASSKLKTTTGHGWIFISKGVLKNSRVYRRLSENENARFI
jgi:hypothetical protein